MEQAAELEQLLRNLPGVGRRLETQRDFEVWGFEFHGRAYLLAFYPRGGLLRAMLRWFGGNPALREFRRLQSLQKARVPSPRAVALLIGYRLEGRRGDALILEDVRVEGVSEPSA